MNATVSSGRYLFDKNTQKCEKEGEGREGEEKEKCYAEHIERRARVLSLLTKWSMR
jgi:hypothetical protein